MHVTLGINENKIIVTGYLKTFPRLGYPVEVFSHDLKTMFIQTSSVADIRVADDSNNLIITTQNSTYLLAYKGGHSYL